MPDLFRVGLVEFAQAVRADLAAAGAPAVVVEALPFRWSAECFDAWFSGQAPGAVAGQVLGDLREAELRRMFPGDSASASPSVSAGRTGEG